MGYLLPLVASLLLPVVPPLLLPCHCIDLWRCTMRHAMRDPAPTQPARQHSLPPSLICPWLAPRPTLLHPSFPAVTSCSVVCHLPSLA